MKRLISMLVILVTAIQLLAACSSGTGVEPTAATNPTSDSAQATEAPPATTAPAATTESTEPTAAPTSDSAAATGKPIKIGLITDQSKALSLYGTQEINGFMLGLEYATNGTMQVAGRPIEVIVKDDENNPERARQLARD